MVVKEKTVCKVLDGISELCYELECEDKVDDILQGLVSVLEDVVGESIRVQPEVDNDNKVSEMEFDFIRSCKAEGMSNMEILKMFTELAETLAKSIGDDGFAEFSKMRMIKALLMYED